MAESLEQLEASLRDLEQRRPGLEERLRTPVVEASGLEADIERSTRAEQDILASPSAARAKFQGVFNLADREALVAERVAREQGLVDTLSNIRDVKGKKVEDVIKNLVALFDTELAGSEAAYGRGVERENLRMAEERMAEEKRQFDEQMALSRETARRSGGGGGGTGKEKTSPQEDFFSDLVGLSSGDSPLSEVQVRTTLMGLYGEALGSDFVNSQIDKYYNKGAATGGEAAAQTGPTYGQRVAESFRNTPSPADAIRELPNTPIGKFFGKLVGGKQPSYGPPNPSKVLPGGAGTATMTNEQRVKTLFGIK